MPKASLKQAVEPASKSNESISLESDLGETRAKANPYRRLSSFEIRNPARGVATVISILQEHYLAVTVRRGSRVHDHNVDLRFVDPKPQAFRKVAWRWLYAALSFTVLAVVTLLAQRYVPLDMIQHHGLSAAVLFGTAALSCCFLFYYFTVESLLFLSVNGRVAVVSINGNFGTVRRASQCAAEIVKQIQVAHRAFRQSKSSYLRDEMREHARLMEQGALTDKQYAVAKQLILRAHDR